MAADSRETTHVIIFSQQAGQTGRFSKLFDMSGLKARIAENTEDFNQYLAANSVDLIILAAEDVDSPAFELCSELRMPRSDQREVPVVFVFSSEIPPEIRIQSLHMGAYDYIVEPYNEIELLTKVAVLANVKHVETEFRELAIRDRLTGLFDRRHLMVRMQEEFSRARRYENPISILAMDVVNFGEINDRFGIEAGDSVLKHLAELLVESKREIDVAARLGEDCFVMVLYKTDQAGALVLANRLLDNISDADWALEEGYKLSMSMGLASTELTRDTEMTANDLHNQAETALQAAKETAGSQLVVFTPELLA